MKIVLVAHDIRSTHNVGAFFRTCDGLGIDEILFSGYTPYPKFKDDTRLPHFADKITRQIHKTALGAETTVPFRVFAELVDVLAMLKDENYQLISLEQATSSQTPKQICSALHTDHAIKIALIVGNEIHGVNDEVLAMSDYVMEIPMHGQKESLNVSIATGIALYELSSIS